MSNKHRQGSFKDLLGAKPIVRQQGIVNREGGFKEIDRHTLPVIDTPLVLPNNNLASSDRQLSKLATIDDVFTNRTSINPQRFHDEYAMLLGFPDGTPAFVTYFHRNTPGITDRNIRSEIDYHEDNVHVDLTKINQFELRLVEEIQHNPDDEDDSFIMSFTAVTYPGFIPSIGDVFFMDIGDGKVGECKVDDCVRTTYRHGFYHRISVLVSDYLTTEKLNFYRSKVRDEKTFDKLIYFNTDFTILDDSTFADYEELLSIRKKLVQWYFNRFYVKTARTLVREDGIYDPYVVEYMGYKASMTETNYRPTQLFPRLPNYESSIWYLLLEARYTIIENLIPTYALATFNRSLFNTDINWLINKDFVLLGEANVTSGYIDISRWSCACSLSNKQKEQKVDSYPYVFSSNFYAGLIDQMTFLERMVYDIKIFNKINIKEVIRIVSTFYSLDAETAFYHIPIYLYLIDMAVRGLTHLKPVR